MRLILTFLGPMLIFSVGWPSLHAAEVRDLVKSLDSRAYQRRRAAIEELATMGRAALPAVPRLIQFLQPAEETAFLRKTVHEFDEESRIHESATAALAAIGEPEVVEALLQFAVENDKRRLSVSPAVDALARIKNPSGVAALKTALGNRDPRVRRTALEALVPSHYPSLLEAIVDGEAEIRRLAVQHARGFGVEKALAALGRALHDPDPVLRLAAIRELETLEDRRAVALLTAAAKDSRDDIRYAAVNALGQFSDSRVVDALILALQDKTPMIRSAAARGLGNAADPRAVAPLKAATGDSDSFVRRHAEAALREISSRNRLGESR